MAEALLNAVRPTIKTLQAFFKAHWEGRYLFGPGSYNPKTKPKIDIDTFSALRILMHEALRAENWELVDEAVSLLPLYEGFLANPRYVDHVPHLANLLKSIAKREPRKANHHIEKLAVTVRKTAADRVFKDGERVSIIRTEHGWFDGRLSGTVKAGSGGYVIEGDDGHEHEIRHLRDIR